MQYIQGSTRLSRQDLYGLVKGQKEQDSDDDEDCNIDMDDINENTTEMDEQVQVN